MILTKDTNDARFQIRSYRHGFIAVNEHTYQTSLLITANQLITNWSPQSLLELQPENWLPALELSPELILLGTGKHFKMPAHHLLAPVYTQKIGIECMDTGAACRTYMALVAEGRRVLAALLIN